VPYKGLALEIRGIISGWHEKDKCIEDAMVSMEWAKLVYGGTSEITGCIGGFHVKQSLMGKREILCYEVSDCDEVFYVLWFIRPKVSDGKTCRLVARGSIERGFGIGR